MYSSGMMVNSTGVQLLMRNVASQNQLMNRGTSPVTNYDPMPPIRYHKQNSKLLIKSSKEH
jgi:hypothetical protein